MFPYSCRPPIPRPEPFSPLPWRGADPDWGKWIRDRLAEKGALLAFPARAAFPAAGDSPSLYLAEDTGVLYRWNGAGYAVLVDPASDVETYPGRSSFPDTGRPGAIYIDASANLLYRWDGTGYVLLTSDLSDVESRLADAESKIPAQATAQNQLADKAFVNSSIATNTAFYISDGGRPFQSLADLESYEGALTNNDYAFVVGRDAAGNTTYTRYKWNEATEAWGEEYVLNNSSFTAEQWAAISSGITSGLVAKLGALPTAEALATALAGKQDVLTFDNAPTAGSSNPVKSGGIWSMTWGALSALPTGVASLYDWCVAQFAKYLPLTGGTITGDVEITNGSGNVAHLILDDRSALTLGDPEYGAELSVLSDTGSRLRLWGYGTSEYLPTKITFQPTYGGTIYDMLFPSASGTLALISDIYAAVQQIAPAWVSGTTYEANALVTYNGKIYCNKFSGTFVSTIPPSADTNWEAKPVSELFLPVLGGEKIDDLVIREGGIKLYGNTSDYWAIYKDAQGIYLYNGTDAYSLVPNDGTRTGGGIFALTAGVGHAGNLAALDSQGNPTDSGWTADALARYAHVTKTVDNGAATLDDIAINAVGLPAGTTSATLTLPAAVQGRARDFIVRLTLAAATSVSFTAVDNITWDSSGDPSGTFQAGTHLLSFTEVAPGVFRWGRPQSDLAGRSFDFSTTQGVMDALDAVVTVLGGSVLNKPSAT